MLKSLLIRNYALIRKHEILFSNGFSVITGETGAGKSIMLGALALLLGKRADTTVLMDKSKKCIVEGTFDISKLGFKDLFLENDIDYDEVSFLRREIVPSGKSRAFINDTPVKLNLLKFIGEKLVDVHSQHQTLIVANPVFQLETLDVFIGKPSVLNEYREIFYAYKKANQKLTNLVEQREKALRDEDYIRFQFEELQNAELDSEDFYQLVERSKFLENAEFVIQNISQANEQLNGGENTLIDKVEYLKSNLIAASKYLGELSEMSKRVESVSIELKDIANEIGRLDSLADFDPGEQQKVNSRLDLIYRLQQKHQVNSVEDLIALKNEYDLKLQHLNTSNEQIISLQKEVDQLYNTLASKATELTVLRKQSAKNFAKAVKDILVQLALKDAIFEVQINSLSEFSKDGNDKVLFLFNANKGGKPGEIGQVASGGELSRLMLAIKSLINREQLLPTVIFDEIDSGVSGDIAAKVGAILKSMSKHHQLIVISHLPQIVAKADHHYRVYKEADEDSTVTFIQRLDESDRVEEIAKLLSGETISDSALKTAKELMN